MTAKRMTAKPNDYFVSTNQFFQLEQFVGKSFLLSIYN